MPAHKLDIRQVSVADPGPHQVRGRVTFRGVCSWDLLSSAAVTKIPVRFLSTLGTKESGCRPGLAVFSKV